MDDVLIAVRVVPLEHLGLTSKQRVQEKLNRYKEKGYKVDMQKSTATNGRLKYVFISEHLWEQKIRGMRPDDIIGGSYEDESRIKRYLHNEHYGR